MFSELDKYKNNGHFFFERGQTLSKVCNAPEQAGVYYILMLRKGKIELVYIGASSTINQKGEFSSQLLRGRLNNKQNGTKRQHFFEEIMLQKEIVELDIYWFVTFDKDNRHLPSYVEALLLQNILTFMGICQNGINVSNKSADAPSQAYLQGTQSRHTKANPDSNRDCLVPTLPGQTLPQWTQTFNSCYQYEGRT